MVKWDLVSFVLRSEYRKKVLEQLTKPITPTKIAEKTGYYPTHVSKVLGELVEKKLAELLTPNERVGKLYRLSKLGREVLDDIDKIKE